MKIKIKHYPILFIILGSIISCQDSIDEENLPVPYPEIGGYENSDEIAANNLITKLSFEDNLSDAIGNINGATGNNSYTTGVKGKAYNGSSSTKMYAVANATPAITSLNAFTISFWLNSANTVVPNPPGQGKGAQGIFSIVRPTEFWGGINIFIENPNATYPDRIKLKISVENGRTGVSWRGQGAIINLDNLKNTWAHITLSYDPTVSRLYAYVNGESATNIDGFAYSPSGGAQGYASWFASDPGGLSNPNNAPGYGNLEMVGTNGRIVFGNHQFETDPPENNGGNQDWATSFAGKLDEFRIYNTSLSAGDINALFQLEKDGR